MNKSSRLSQDFLFSTFVTVLLVITCLCFYGYFFSIDDVMQEFSGFYKQYGKLWLNGELPLIVPDMVVGQNSVIEMQRAIFTPQAIIASILAELTGKIRAVGISLAFMNLFLMTFSAIQLGKSLKLSRNYCYLMALTLACNPFFLYQYLGPWPNAAIGNAWMMAAIASFVYLVRHYSVKGILINFICVAILLCSGWPHGTLIYISICAIIWIILLAQKKSFKYLVLLALPSFLALLSTLFIYLQ